MPQEAETRAPRPERRTTLVGLCALAGAQTLLCAPLAAAPAASPPGCAPRAFDSAQYTVCSFDVRRDDIRLYWSGADDKPYANFAALASAMSAKGRTLRFAMNAGMFGDDFAPVGLYVENGKQLRRADTRPGPTNFHLLPNGVFWVGDGVAGVEETSRFLNDAPAAKFATQSGPMLVIDGHIHPKILPTGTSEKVRNGVCVRDGATAVFAISETSVTFNAFARLFRDALGCSNALFLDGSVSSLYAPDIGRDDELTPLGPMIGVSAPTAPH